MQAQAWEQKGQRPVLASASARVLVSERAVVQQGPVSERAVVQQVLVSEWAVVQQGPVPERALAREPEQVSLREHCPPSLCPSRATRFPSIPGRQQQTKLLT